ncbi:MAG: right-handed parallel beta-helix repeat-containing protein [Candidatus Odinarchaeota archaeon]
MKLSTFLFFSILLLGVVNGTVLYRTVENSSSARLSPISHPFIEEKSGSQAYVSHSPISITSNDQFALQGFPGSGTLDDPYRIEGYSINVSNGDSITISNTAVHFQISNNKLDGLGTASSGISLCNVKNARIEHNIVINSVDAGIEGTNVSDSIFYNNSIYSNAGFGIFLVKARNSTLTANTIHGNMINGMHLKDTSNTTINNNSIYNHQHGEHARSGVLLDNSTSVVIINNTLFDNHYGINLLDAANDNLITNNTVYTNLKHGIRIEYASRNSIIHNNIIDSHLYGILITSGSNDNTIQYNNFSGNNAGDTQATDDGAENIFAGNYWDDWHDVDTEGDKITDDPYPIDGAANNTDLYPLVDFSAEAIENAKKKIDNSGNSLLNLLVLFALVVIVASTSGGYFYYNRRSGKPETENEHDEEDYTTGIDPPDRIEILTPIYHKIVIGLENIYSEALPRPKKVPLLEPAEAKTLVDYIPSDIKDDLRSGMKWRTIMTLIEIAYQDPAETSPVKLAKSLNLPLSTLSKEIKKLKELQYVETFASAQVLRDGRYRNFAITSKGFTLLYTLKEASKSAIDRLKEKQDYYHD